LDYSPSITEGYLLELNKVTIFFINKIWIL